MHLWDSSYPDWRIDFLFAGCVNSDREIQHANDHSITHIRIYNSEL
jgi:hypothetical protein